MSEVNNNEELALPPQYSRSRDNQVTNNFNINNESSYTQVEPPLYAESTPSDQESDLPQEYHKRRQIQQEENECSICCRDCCSSWCFGCCSSNTRSVDEKDRWGTICIYLCCCFGVGSAANI